MVEVGYGCCGDRRSDELGLEVTIIVINVSVVNVFFSSDCRAMSLDPQLPFLKSVRGNFGV